MLFHRLCMINMSHISYIVTRARDNSQNEDCMYKVHGYFYEATFLDKPRVLDGDIQIRLITGLKVLLLF